MDKVEKLEQEVQELMTEHFPTDTEATVEGTPADTAPPKEEAAPESKAEEAVAEETAAEGTPTEGVSTEAAPDKAEKKEIPWEKRYNDLRPWTVKTSQENAQLRNELDAARQYIESMKAQQPKSDEQAKPLEDIFATVKEEYSDLAETLVPALETAITQMSTSQQREVERLKNEVNMLRQRAVAGDGDAFSDAVRKVHDDFETLTGSPELQEWLGKNSKTLPAKVKVAMFRDSDPASAISLLNAYKAEAGMRSVNKDNAKQTHTEAVKQAAQAVAEPRSGGSNPHSLALSQGKSKFGTLADIANMDNDEYLKHANEILADCKAGLLR